MAKVTITAARLADLLMVEIRRRPECLHVSGVAFTRPPQTAPHRPNWAPAFACDRARSAPAVAWEIARKFQNEYDLIFDATA
jgi:hypothetical protein